MILFFIGKKMKKKVAAYCRVSTNEELQQYHKWERTQYCEEESLAAFESFWKFL